MISKNAWTYFNSGAYGVAVRNRFLVLREKCSFQPFSSRNKS
jgi:hypothetical protein